PFASASWAAGRRPPNTARLVALAARDRLAQNFSAVSLIEQTRAAIDVSSLASTRNYAYRTARLDSPPSAGLCAPDHHAVAPHVHLHPARPSLPRRAGADRRRVDSRDQA